jgi:hypothetical protein
MTTTLGSPAPTTQRSQPLLLCAVVAVGVVAGWLAYDHWVLVHLEQRIFEWDVLVRHDSIAILVLDILQVAPYAVVLLIWGRTRGRRVVGALLALGTAAYMWVLYEWFSRVIGDDGTASSTWLDVYAWVYLLVVPTLFALAWGVARRWGRLWVAGLLVAPALSAIFYELQLHSAWWQEHVIFDQHAYHWLVRDAVFIGPAVLAAVACWLVELTFARRTRDRASSATML